MGRQHVFILILVLIIWGDAAIAQDSGTPLEWSEPELIPVSPSLIEYSEDLSFHDVTVDKHGNWVVTGVQFNREPNVYGRHRIVFSRGIAESGEVQEIKYASDFEGFGFHLVETDNNGHWIFLWKRQGDNNVDEYYLGLYDFALDLWSDAVAVPVHQNFAEVKSVAPVGEDRWQVFYCTSEEFFAVEYNASAGEWSAPVEFSVGPGSRPDVQISLDKDGNVLLVAEQQYQNEIGYRYYDTESDVWSELQTFTSDDLYIRGADIRHLDGVGFTILYRSRYWSEIGFYDPVTDVWTTGIRVKARSHDVVRSGAGTSVAAVDDYGNLVVSWINSIDDQDANVGYTVYSSEEDVWSEPTPARPHEGDSLHFVSALGLSFSPASGFTLVGTLKDANEETRAVGFSRAAFSGKWKPPDIEEIPVLNFDLFSGSENYVVANADADSYQDHSPSLAYLGDGKWIAVWKRGFVTDRGVRENEIAYSVYDQYLGSWTPPGTVNSPHSDIVNAYPKITADGNGTAVSTWEHSRTTNGGYIRHYSVFRADTGEWSEPRTLPEGIDRINADRSGNWMGFGQVVSGGYCSISPLGCNWVNLYVTSWAKFDPDSGEWSDVMAIDPGSLAESHDHRNVSIAPDDFGNWMAAWTRWGEEDRLISEYSVYSKSEQAWSPRQMVPEIPASRTRYYYGLSVAAGGKNKWLYMMERADRELGELEYRWNSFYSEFDARKDSWNDFQELDRLPTGALRWSTLAGDGHGQWLNLMFGSSELANWTEPRLFGAYYSTELGRFTYPDMVSASHFLIESSRLSAIMATDQRGNWVVMWTGQVPATESSLVFHADLKYATVSLALPLDRSNEDDEDDSTRPCFIATAAYGTPLAEELGVLREFRDEVLLESAWGTAFVDVYYRVSPAAADWVARRTVVRLIVRMWIGAVILVLLHPLLAASGVIALAVCVGTRRRQT